MHNLYCLTYDMNCTSEQDLMNVASAARQALPSGAPFLIMPYAFQLSKLNTETLVDLKIYLEAILDNRLNTELEPEEEIQVELQEEQVQGEGTE